MSADEARRLADHLRIVARQIDRGDTAPDTLTIRDAAEQIERLTAERDRLQADILAGQRIANALTLETQTVEEMAADLVRLVNEARAERDALASDLQTLAQRHAQANADALQAEESRLRFEESRLREMTAERESLRAALRAREDQKDGYDIMGLAEEQRQNPGPFSGHGMHTWDAKDPT